MDALSDILSGVKLNGALYFSAEFSAPWGFSTPPSSMLATVNKLATVLAPEAPHLVIFHFVTEGEAFVELDNGQAEQLSPGDVIILPHGDAHRMTSGKDATATAETVAIASKVKSRDLTPLHAGGGGKKTRFVCGYMACDPHQSRPILSGLPHMFKVNIRADRSGQWLENSILQLVKEAASERAGSAAMLAKLSEALFVDTLRRYVDTLPEQKAGWLAGARDPIVGKCLGLLHGRVANRWTIASLAEEVGISRSALVERFTRYLSDPPMTYLTRWRLQIGAQSLERTSRGVAEIAGEVGYESEAAFSRAFRREYGQPPGQYRRNHRPAKNKTN